MNYLVLELVQGTITAAHEDASALCANDLDHVHVVRRQRNASFVAFEERMDGKTTVNNAQHSTRAFTNV